MDDSKKFSKGGQAAMWVKINTLFLRINIFFVLLVILELLPVSVILFWIIRVFIKKDVSPVQLLMVAGMLMSVLTFLSENAMDSFIFPFFFLAIQQAISRNGISKWYWLVLLPSLAFVPFKESQLFIVFFVFQIVVLSVWLVIKLKRYKALLSEYFENSEELVGDLNLILLFLIATEVIIVIIMTLPSVVISILWVAALFSFLVSISLFMMGSLIYGLKGIPESDSSMTITEIKTELLADKTFESNQDALVSSRQIDDSLLSRVISEKLYLDPMISLVSLADKLHTNRTYLSNSIHSCYNQNFSDFINTLRIKYSLEIMKADLENISIKDVAFKSGYNHIQSFYRNFVLVMDMTPKTWISKQLHSCRK